MSGTRPEYPEVGVVDAAVEALAGGDAATTERTSASWNFPEGTLIAEGRSVMKSLGGGSRYEVYLAWDDRLFALVVTKILRPDHVEDERALRELGREVEVLQRLAHPILVRSFGAVLDGPYPHVVLEHLEGPTLRRLIKRHGPLPLEQLLPLALHVAAALHYVSTEKVVHLDVKPSNIVMGVPPRLIDLSIARSFDSAAKLHAPIGTDAYMAPEQCDPVACAGRVGPAADVWGLGATLHHAITGAVPFPRPRDAAGSTDASRRFPQLVDPPPPLPKDVPRPLRDLVASMLARDPSQRPVAGAVATALEPLVLPLPQKVVTGRRGWRFVSVVST